MNKTPAEKIAALRAEMKKQGLDGFLVPRADEFMGEYVPACGERLSWLTDFTGSWGLAVILDKSAVVMTDGRYAQQVKAEIDPALYQTTSDFEQKPEDWLKAHAAPGAKIGYDPRLHTVRATAGLQAELQKKGMALTAVARNPVDVVWNDRPAPPNGSVERYPEKIAGLGASEKSAKIAAAINDTGGYAMVITQPDSIAWLLNIRGRDVPHTPFALSYAIVHGDGDIDWFISPAKIGADVRAHIGNRVRVCDPTDLASLLVELAVKAAGKPVLLDFARSAQWFKQVLEGAGAKVQDQEDPCLLPKACKTAAEQAFIRDTHVRDGVAMVRFLKWLDDEAPKGKLTELDIMAHLESCRRRDPGYRDSSFTTIAGWAGNGAIVHYRATEKTNAAIKPPGILLVDSGGQYLEGTTDITRTVAVGTPTAEMRESFTRVLRGHINVATAVFPEGTIGAQIDALAREPLWAAGMDYDHGTGHGVGCYLSVHEESATISKRGQRPFKPGMLLSNEPGYYKEGAYGIRIESLLLVREAGTRTDRPVRMLGFDTITLAPIDRRLVVKDMMTVAEIEWLDGYHASVLRMIQPLVEADAQAWLRNACALL